MSLAKKKLTPSELPELLLLTKVPESVTLWGALPGGPRVAIVGSRGASRDGLSAAHQLARELSRSGVCVVSGGAHGIDRAAHEGALEGGAPTLVVAPLPFERAYPSAHGSLFERICREGGGYVTRSEANTPPVQATFFARNELLCALSTLVVVGESRFRSGARNAVSHAVRQRRPLFVLPSPYGAGVGKGSNALLGRVARAVLSSEQLLRCLLEPAWPGVEEGLALMDREAGRLEPPVQIEARKRRPGALPSASHPQFTPDDAGRVLRAIHEGARTPEDVVLRTGLSPAQVTYELVLHTLSGTVVEDRSGLLSLAFS